MKKKLLHQTKMRRMRRTSARVRAASSHPRLVVFRSNRSIYTQLIDDARGHTIVAASSREVKKEKSMSKVDCARKVGSLLAERAAKAKIAQAVFDRRAYRYHGRVKALVEGAREGGLHI